MSTALHWSDLSKFLSSPTINPRNTLLQWYHSGQLAAQLPEVHTLFGIPQPPAHHPEIDTGVHTLMVVEQAWLRSKDPSVVFAALVHDLGKGITPQDKWPKHTDHETNGKPLVEDVCKRIGAPEHVRKLALLVCEYHLHGHRAFEMRPGSMVQWLEKTGLLFDPQMRRNFMTACEADARGRTGLENREYLSPYLVEKVAQLALSAWHIEAQQERLQEAITRVKHHYAPFSNKENLKALVRKESGFEPVLMPPEHIHEGGPAC